MGKSENRYLKSLLLKMFAKYFNAIPKAIP